LGTALDALDGADEPQPNPADPAPKPNYAHAYGQPDPNGAADWCYDQHTARHGPPPALGGGHNHWVAAFAKFCNESGAPLNDVLALALSTAPAGHDARKIEATVRGIYSRDAADFGSKPYTLPRTATATAYPADKGASTALLPTFGADVYEALPDYLRRCCQPFDGHEKAVMLLGCLAVLSGCFPGVGGTYNRKAHGLNLYVFVLAPAASGKGTLAWAQYLARLWHKRLIAESAAALADYEAEQNAHKAAGKGKGNHPAPPPAAPPRRMLFLPGNTTAAAMLGHLSENDGRGIIFETEADTLSGALGADFGNFSDVLRKAFHHEPVSALRKTDRQHLDLERPALSIALTGTPGQLPRLLPTAEDGLVSRILFYSFAQAPVWQDVSPAAGPPLDAHFAPLADELTRMIEATPDPDPTTPGAYPVLLHLTPADWGRLNEAGKAGLSEAAAAGGAAPSTAYRLGLIAWRITGLLTVLRCFENGELPAGHLAADPADVTTALSIMGVARAHALNVLASLPRPAQARAGTFADKADREAGAKEMHSQGHSLREIAHALNIGKSTVERWLKTAA